MVNTELVDAYIVTNLRVIHPFPFSSCSEKMKMENSSMIQSVSFVIRSMPGVGIWDQWLHILSLPTLEDSKSYFREISEAVQSTFTFWSLPKDVF